MTLFNVLVLLWRSVACFGFRVSPSKCLYYFLFGWGCWLAIRWERAAHSLDHISLCILQFVIVVISSFDFEGRFGF